MNYSQLFVYNEDNYNTPEAAEQEGALYNTGSTIDSLHKDNMSGVLDMIEVVDCLSECAGGVNLVGCVVNSHKYIKLTDLI